MAESETQFIRRNRRETLCNDFKRLRRHQQEAIAKKIGLEGVETADELFLRVYACAKEKHSVAYFWEITQEYGHRSRNHNPWLKPK